MRDQSSTSRRKEKVRFHEAPTVHADDRIYPTNEYTCVYGELVTPTGDI